MTSFPFNQFQTFAFTTQSIVPIGTDISIALANILYVFDTSISSDQIIMIVNIIFDFRNWKERELPTDISW